MKIIVAADSFKGSLTSVEVGEAVKRGLNNSLPQAKVCIMGIADGGEGTLEAIVYSLQGEIVECPVTGPMGQTVNAQYGIAGDMAVIEIARACGLTLVPEENRNPCVATSYGVGELILNASKRGCENFIIGLGGSATNDGGVGMLQALGYSFKDSEGKEIGRGGLEVNRIAAIDDSGVLPMVRKSKFKVASDVRNPLFGIEGASYVFGPQKGADEMMVSKLDTGLRKFAEVTKRFTDNDKSQLPGVGAAGGLGFAFVAFLNSEIRSGIETVLEVLDFDNFIEGADLIITGEGCLDMQTLQGKAPYGVLKKAMIHNIPVIGIGGKIEEKAYERLKEEGFSELIAVSPAEMDLKEAMKPEIALRNIERAISENTGKMRGIIKKRLTI